MRTLGQICARAENCESLCSDARGGHPAAEAETAKETGHTQPSPPGFKSRAPDFEKELIFPVPPYIYLYKFPCPNSFDSPSWSGNIHLLFLQATINRRQKEEKMARETNQNWKKAEVAAHLADLSSARKHDLIFIFHGDVIKCRHVTVLDIFGLNTRNWAFDMFRLLK
jgi:hypothetical protein